MTNQYTPIELSRLIQSKVPEVKTGMWHRSPLPHFGYHEWTIKDCELAHGAESVTAYRLDDVLTCIKVWGEKNGKMGVCADCGAENIKKCPCYKDVGVENWDVWHSHRLLTAFLADDGFGDRCERVLRDIFN